MSVSAGKEGLVCCLLQEFMPAGAALQSMPTPIRTLQRSNIECQLLQCSSACDTDVTARDAQGVRQCMQDSRSAAMPQGTGKQNKRTFVAHMHLLITHPRCHLDKHLMAAAATHRVRVQTMLQVLAQGLCRVQVQVRVLGSWPAEGRVRVQRVLLVLAQGPCRGQVQVHEQGSWPAEDLQAKHDWTVRTYRNQNCSQVEQNPGPQLSQQK